MTYQHLPIPCLMALLLALAMAGCANVTGGAKEYGPGFSSKEKCSDAICQLRQLQSEAKDMSSSAAPSAVRNLYRDRCDEIIQSLAPTSDAVSVLQDASIQDRQAGDDQTAVSIWKEATDQAIVSLKFRPVIEANLPEGFPEPSPPGVIRVKTYPVLRIAKVSQPGSDNSRFRSLFNHIKKNEIAMTAPVEMTYQQPQQGNAVKMSQQAMGFYYPSLATGQVGQDGNVQIVETKPVTVVSIGQRGAYTQGRFEKAFKRLDEWLEENSNRYVKDGPGRVLAYNSPFVLWFLKYSEVQIPVRAVTGE